jgi:glycosyltransferase involved in cell wall biosynthesis
MWLCCQIGAREHYAVPRALHQRNRLAALYTDFWAGPVWRRLGCTTVFRPLRSLAARFHPELAEAPIVSWNTRALLSAARLRQKPAAGSRHIGYVKAGHDFASAVRESLRRRRDLPGDTVLFAYDTGALEVFEWCRERGIKCVLDQMDPSRAEVEMVRDEEKRWPGWTTQITEVPEEYFRRREGEWALADRIVVNSEFCRQTLISQGVAPEKLVIIPLCYEPEAGKVPKPGPTTLNLQLSTAPLRVLFLGQVILRKGIQYLLEAARLLERENIRFDIVGPIGITPQAMASAPRNVVFHGRATRDQAAGWYRKADLFVLPTISDGFAITQLEAMAHGLPVVATPCCGNVVSDGVDGFLVRPYDAEALAKALLRYLAGSELLRSHQAAAFAKSKQFTLARLAANLLRLESTLLNS